MPLWLVKATWTADESESSEQWEVNAETAQDAVQAVTAHLRFHPHHVEARQLASVPAQEALATDLAPGEVRRIPQ
jgi:hypothetical protein